MFGMEKHDGRIGKHGKINQAKCGYRRSKGTGRIKQFVCGKTQNSKSISRRTRADRPTVYPCKCFFIFLNSVLK